MATSIYNALFTGSEPVTLAAGSTIGGSLLGGLAPVTVAPATTTLTLSPALHNNRVVTIASSAGLTITPPAATGTGNIYQLFVITTVAGGNVTLDAKAGNASDVFYGFAYTYKATTFTNYATASNTNLITWDGSTMGGIIGDWLYMQDIATHVWLLRIQGTQSGTIASPFSNH